MIDNFIRRFALCLIVVCLLSGCGSQATIVQITPTLQDTATNTPAPISTPAETMTPVFTLTASATPCLGLIAAPVSTPLPWPYSDYWDKVAISRLSVQDMECAKSEEIVSKLVLQWLETIKTNSKTGKQCGLEDYTLDLITIKENTITPQYEIVAGVDYHVKLGRFGDCGWITGRGEIEKDGWLRTSDIFGIYRENGDFRLIVLPGWGT